MKFQSFFSVAWPSMLGACLVEMLVFAVIDPQQIPALENTLGISAHGIYTVAFFAFLAGHGHGLHHDTTAREMPHTRGSRLSTAYSDQVVIDQQCRKKH